MRIIKSWQDIQLLREGKALPEELITSLEKCLEQLEKGFEGGAPTEKEGIYPYCLVLLFEAGDNAVNLAPILTGSPANGLMDANFEYVKHVELECGEFYYTLFLDDGRQMHLFIPVGINGFYIESKLKRLVERDQFDKGAQK